MCSVAGGRRQDSRVLERLIDLLVSLWGALVPVTIVDQWEAGVVLRRGVNHRPLGVGLRWRLPLFEEWLRVDTRQTTERTPMQTVRVPSGKTWTVSLSVTWHVDDAPKYLLEVYDAANVVIDALLGSTAACLQSWDESDGEKLAHDICTHANRRAKRWGVRFDRVQLADCCQAPAVRLLRTGADDYDGVTH